MKKQVKYEIKKFSPIRQILSDFNDEAASMPHVLGLLEIDVTDARRIIKEVQEREGLKLSFTGWIAKCIGDAVKENKRLNSFLKGRSKIIIFENVDISIMIEIKNEKGQEIPYNHIIRKIETKNIREITEEIRSVQNRKIEGKDQVRGRSSIALKIYSFVPKFIRRMIMKILLRNPFYIQKTAGTVGLTTVGMFIKKVGGWAIPYAIKTLSVAVAGIKEKPAIVDDKIEKRDIANVTFLVDHNLVDGAPSTRFIARVVDLMESAYGLEEFV
ncbi:MAG: hypothetical protein HGN29_12695 [Asgard group archaeon]|nr:hypothetical protein [Asgard group archaeon]